MTSDRWKEPWAVLLCLHGGQRPTLPKTKCSTGRREDDSERAEKRMKSDGATPIPPLLRPAHGHGDAAHSDVRRPRAVGAVLPQSRAAVAALGRSAFARAVRLHQRVKPALVRLPRQLDVALTMQAL